MLYTDNVHLCTLKSKLIFSSQCVCHCTCRFPIAVVLCDVLRTTSRPKVQRVILATFKVYTAACTINTIESR